MRKYDQTFLLLARSYIWARTYLFQ